MNMKFCLDPLKRPKRIFKGVSKIDILRSLELSKENSLSLSDNNINEIRYFYSVVENDFPMEGNENSCSICFKPL